MNEKELLRNLSALKSVAPSGDWVKKNRELLSFQIFNGQEPAKNEFGWFANFSLAAHRLLQPAPIAALIALFFFVSGGIGLRAAKNAKPESNLYIGKIISEKLQGVATIDQNKKAELNLRFAQNRIIEMAELDKTEGSEESAAAVAASFKNEIASVRQQLDRLNEEQAKQAAIAAQTQAKAKLNLSKATKKADDKAAETSPDENGAISTAGSGKDAQGLDISLPDNSQKVLEEAQKLFDEKKYDEAATKLGEIKLK